MPSESIAFFEGRYMPVKEAKISIADPAVTKSDIVFDVVSVTGRVFFRLDDHVDRFETSCRKTRIALPVSSDEIKRIPRSACIGPDSTMPVSSCAARADLIAAAAFSAIRAIASMASTPTRCPTITSCRRECVETGAHIWIAETRRAPNAAIDQTVKNFNRMDLTKGTFEALDQGADAAVLLSIEGYVAEGPGFNVWIVRGNALLTPADNLLEGITAAHGF